MGVIKLNLVVRAPIDELFKMAQDVERTPKYMSALRNLKVLERCPKGSFVRCEWTAQAKFLSATRDMVWIQEDRWDKKDHVCRFRLLKSKDMKKLDGEWWFVPHDKGTEMKFEVDFRVNHPLMTNTIHRLLDQVMRKNNQSMLMGLKKDAEQKFWEKW
ncbi:MAG: SRPBCC family protein [bacterium]